MGRTKTILLNRRVPYARRHQKITYEESILAHMITSPEYIHDLVELKNIAHMFQWTIEHNEIYSRNSETFDVDKIKRKLLMRPITKQTNRHIQEPNF